MRGTQNIIPHRICAVLNTKWSRYVKQIQPKENSIVLVTRPKTQSEEDFAEALKRFADELLSRIGVSSVVVGVDNLSDIQSWDEATMERYGWVRRERVLAFVEDRFADLIDEEE